MLLLPTAGVLLPAEQAPFYTSDGPTCCAQRQVACIPVLLLPQPLLLLLLLLLPTPWTTTCGAWCCTESLHAGWHA
jgi:hypothetical protein